MYPPTLAREFADTFYLVYRLLAIVSMIVVGLVTKPEAPLGQPDVSRYESGTIDELTNLTLDSVQHRALVEKVLPRLRTLRAVLERLPKTFTPYPHVPEYRLTYYVERLACGHERIYYPQAGPMTKRRLCPICTEALQSALPQKKPVCSVCAPLAEVRNEKKA